MPSPLLLSLISSYFSLPKAQGRSPGPILERSVDPWFLPGLLRAPRA